MAWVKYIRTMDLFILVILITEKLKEKELIYFKMGHIIWEIFKTTKPIVKMDTINLILHIVEVSKKMLLMAKGNNQANLILLMESL